MFASLLKAFAIEEYLVDRRRGGVGRGPNYNHSIYTTIYISYEFLDVPLLALYHHAYSQSLNQHSAMGSTNILLKEAVSPWSTGWTSFRFVGEPGRFFEPLRIFAP